jgi:hypothetical protein
MGGRLPVLLGILALAAVLAMIFRDPLSSISGDEVARIVYLLLALLLVGGGAFGGGRMGATPLRNALIWICIILGFALGYQALLPWLPPGFGLN